MFGNMTDFHQGKLSSHLETTEQLIVCRIRHNPIVKNNPELTRQVEYITTLFRELEKDVALQNEFVHNDRYNIKTR